MRTIFWLIVAIVAIAAISKADNYQPNTTDLNALRAGTHLPAWTNRMDVRAEADGRVFLIGEVDGCEVYVRPKAWKEVRANMPQRNHQNTYMNYGVNLDASHEVPGTMTTNDPNAGTLAYGAGNELGATAATTAANCDPADPARCAPASSGPSSLSLILFLLGAALAVLIFTNRRRST